MYIHKTFHPGKCNVLLMPCTFNIRHGPLFRKHANKLRIYRNSREKEQRIDDDEVR